jgi:hypothetical protein
LNCAFNCAITVEITLEKLKIGKMQCKPVIVLMVITTITCVVSLPQHIHIRPNKYAEYRPYPSSRVGLNQIDVSPPVAPKTDTTNVSIDVERTKNKTQKVLPRPQFGVITVPRVCPLNQFMDYNGKCRTKSYNIT